MDHFGWLSALAFAAASLGATAQTTRFRDPVFANVDVQRDIAYGSAVNRFTNRRETLLLDRYEPRGDRTTTRPAIVVVHGGGFHGGDKGTTQFRRICTDLARRGYVAVSINYRMKPRNVQITRQVITDAAHDFKAAVRFLRRNRIAWRVDDARIGSIGSSAGAITALEAAYVPGEGNSGNPGFSSKQQAVVDLWGLLADVTSMEKGETPLSIIHGTNDRTVPFSNAQNLRSRAIAVGVPFEYHPLQGAGHGPWNLYARFFPDVIAFYWEHLQLGKLAGLRAVPGFRSPGELVLDQFGIARDLAMTFVAGARRDLDLGELGVFCPDLATLVLVQATVLPAAARLPTQRLRLAIPEGLRGTTFYWQSLRLDSPSTLRLLSNCVPTRF